MSLNKEDRYYHDLYEVMDSTSREAVDEAFNCVNETFKLYGLPTNNADPAECLVAAITRYMIDSKG